MRRISKKGQWQNYLLPAIMAVLVLGISFYFIFNEYFTGEGADREVCKESVIVRSAVPDVKKAGAAISFKDEFPLKCKTNVIEVTKDDVDDGKVDKIIGDALVECWFVFGSGDLNIFPADFYGDKTTCIPCARIHLTNDAKEAVEGGKIDIEGLLNGEKLDDKFFYLNYLNGAGKLFEPFNPAFNSPFNLSGEKFEIGKDSGGNEWSGNDELKAKGDLDLSEWKGQFAKVSLPKYLNVSQGDLIISFGSVTIAKDDKVAAYVPYMFYFQNGQKDYTEELKGDFFSWGTNDGICNTWEGIPA